MVNVENEMQMEIVESYKKIERIVDYQDQDNEEMYLVKWVGLQYAECSWEKASELESEEDQIQITKYHERINEWKKKKSS